MPGQAGVRFGVNIINFGADTDPATLLSWARFAEDRGFDFAMVSDHITVTPDVAEQYPAPLYDPFTTLSWLAGQTERIELGTTVAILPYRHPLHTARVAANVDQFSGGRLILGVGAGWARQEFAALGLPFHSRGAMTDEYLEVITRAWTEESFSFDGKFVSFVDASTGPLPVRRPPVWVGGASTAAIRRTVRFGDAWHPINQRIDWLRAEGLPALRRAAEAAERVTPAFAPRIPLLLTETELDEDTRIAGRGTLDQVRRDVDALTELGATHILFDTYPGAPDQARPIDADQRAFDTLAKHIVAAEA